jgi:hypothetical protein
MITITLPANNIEDAISLRDRIIGLILLVGSNDSVSIDTRGVSIRTLDPVRIIEDLQEEGFIN